MLVKGGPGDAKWQDINDRDNDLFLDDSFSDRSSFNIKILSYQHNNFHFEDDIYDNH